MSVSPDRADSRPDEQPRPSKLRELPAAARIVAVHYRVGMLNELHYRSNLVLQLVQSLFQVGSGLFVVLVVFSHTDQLNGWNRSELLAAVGVFTMVGGLVRALVQPGIVRMMYGIEDGSFDFTLTRPVDAQLLMSVREVNVWQLADVVVGCVILAIALPGLPESLGATDVAALLALLVAAVATAYCMWLLIATIAFWTVRLPAIDNLFYYVGRAAQYPITIYPMWFRVTLTAVVPLGIAVTAPAEAVTSRLGWGTTLAALAALAVCATLSRRVWRRGVRRYSGASA